jgi:hypothetical protein
LNLIIFYIKVYKPYNLIIISYLNEAKTNLLTKMVKRCMFCKGEVSDKSVVDFCRKCGYGVWGPKMCEAIIKEMEEANQRGDLDQGGSGK